MGYAKHIGRVGGLAITLGVGVALASAPGVANADTSSSSSTSVSASTTTATTTATGRDSASPGGAATNDAPTSDVGMSSESADESTTDNSAANDEDTASLADAQAEEDAVAAEDSVGGRSADRHSTQGRTDAEGLSRPEDSSDAESALALEAELSAEPAETVERAPDMFTNAPVDSAEAPPTASPVATELAESEPPAQAQRSAVVDVASVPDSSGQQPLEPSPEAPMGAPMMLAALAAVRDELERSAVRRDATVATSQTQALADPTPNVLVIGVDGTNLSRVLDDPANVNFFELIQTGTTAPASIVGHTTISGPSWSSILTGVWGETTGVINNVFTPWTYDTWATVFNQLETFNPAIQTTSIANWDVISAIASAGSIPADTVVNISQVPGDTDWLLTDDAVGEATEVAIVAADPDVPNFLFSYFVGVDENGHMYGGDSPQYAAAIKNFDRNLGEILEAVADWEALTGEQWTILVTTDHGHQPQKGFGHGFQSPDETSTFVIAENPDLFAAGAINLRYQIVDVTPTVVTLFGGTPAVGSEGVSLTDLGDSNVFPVNDDEALRGSLQDAIAMYGYPDIGTQLALGARTIFATVPYVVYGLTNDVVSSLQAIADQGIFLISLLARLAIAPVQFIGDVTYVMTNTGAQIVARLTGVTGASIFPLWPPAPPSFPTTPEEAAVPDALLLCGDADGLSAALCGEGSMAV
ncbi:MAG: alkaline phosphatase family protein [Actinomycetia bacterium]|nr:alkaline phosphatase family protein [Actinomycetes bacterium]